jgi:nucleotidyltransferase/DNA polymerase involved in DNA repair
MMTCVVIRDFAAAVERLHQPDLVQVPLVILSGGQRARVVATDALARQAGVMAGQAFTQAKGLCPGARFLEAREAVYRRVLDDMLDVLREYANKVEPEYQPTSAAVYLGEVAGLELVPNAIQAFLGVTVGIGTAATKFVARVTAAQAVGTEKILHIESDVAAAFLACYPVGLLPLNKEMARRLPLLGIRTLGQYAALPRFAVWEQFGTHGRWLHDLANGIDIRPLQSQLPQPMLHAAHEWDDAIEDKAIVQRVLARLADQLIQNLADQTAQRTTLIVRTEDRHTLEVDARLAVRTLPVLVRQLTALVDKLSIQAGIQRVEIRLTELAAAKPVQLSLFPEPTAHKKLDAELPRWQMQHKLVAFYRAHLTEAHPLPERCFELHEVVAG